MGVSQAMALPCKRVLAYYTTDHKAVYPSSSIPWAKLTHLCHAFVTPASTGSLVIPSGFVEAGMVSAAHAAGVKVLLSVGGGGGSANFSAVMANSTRRSTFVNAVYSFLKTNGYDGVDVDWEYPATATDKANYSLMISDLRAKFVGSPAPAPSWLITAAVPNGNWAAQYIDFATVKAKMDFFNIMTYDFHGAWSTHTGHNAALDAPAGDPDGATLNMNYVVTYYISTRGVPASQLNLGVPFYGYRSDSIESLHATCPGADCKPETNAGDDYRSIAPLVGIGWTRSWDNSASSPYLRRDSTTGFISYDDPQSIQAKVNHGVNVRGLGGAFMWSLDGDKLSNGTQPLLDAMLTGLACGATPGATVTSTRTVTRTVTPTPTRSMTSPASGTVTRTATPTPTRSMTRTVTPSPAQTPVTGLLIDDFSSQAQYNTNHNNDLGLYTDDDASYASDTVSAGGTLTLTNKAGGYWYTNLAVACFNATAFTHLQFRVRGLAGNETFAVSVKTRNAACSATATEYYVLSTAYFTVTGTLQTVSIPLSAFGADLSKLGSVLVSGIVGTGLELDDLRLVVQAQGGSMQAMGQPGEGPARSAEPELALLGQAPLPNPNPHSIRFELQGQADDVELRVYDSAMACVATAQVRNLLAGWNSLELPLGWAQTAANGVYLYRLSVRRHDKQVTGQVGRLVILR